MTKQSEMQMYKRLMFGAAEVSDRTTMNEVNGIIADANKAAYDGLEDADKRHVRAAMDRLQAKMHGQFGDVQALELLSALAQVLEVNGK